MNKDYLKSNFVKFLLGILILAFVLSSISGILFMTNKYNIINIDGNKININEFINVLNNEKQSIYAANQSKETLDLLNSKDFIFLTIEKMVNSDILDLEIKNFKLKKPEKLILDEIVKESYFFTNGKFDFKKFQNMLKDLNISEKQYIETVQSSQSISFLLASLVDNIVINNNYVDDAFEIANNYKNIDLFRINKNKIKIKLDKIENFEIEDYYNKNIINFMIPEQRKIDYIKIENFKEEDIKKLEDLLLISNNLVEIAKEFKIEIKTYGYVSLNDIDEKNIENISNIKNAFNFSIDDFSNIEKNDNNVLFVFSVTDIKKEYTKNIDESKNEITDLIKEEKINKEYRKIVENYIDEYKKSNFNNKIIIDKGFSIKNLDIYKNNKNFDENFVKEVIYTKDKNITKLYIDNDSLYFGYIKLTKKLDENDKNFINKDIIRGNIYNNINKNIQLEYSKYLKNIKHKVKINYKLLNLIK